MAVCVMVVGAKLFPDRVMSTYSSSAFCHMSHSPYALIAAVHVYVVRGKCSLSNTRAAASGRPQRQDAMRNSVYRRASGFWGFFDPPASFDSKAFACLARTAASAACSILSAFWNWPSTPYAQMSAEATGTSGTSRSPRMSSTSAAAALAPTFPPFAPARISAEYVCDVGVIPASRKSLYAANASRQSPKAPTACMYAVYVYAVGALRPGPCFFIQSITSRTRLSSPRRPATESTVVATCALGVSSSASRS
mmetsp:Transcript_6962/g.28587  ORF Transcript_6962/g.28587 Transcript_6962/m.28587 type:complete len:251 (-) Transcript_6962:334-1086(-)